MTTATAPPLLNTTTVNTTNAKKPVRARKPPKATTPAAAATALNSTSNSSEVPATVKEIPPKANALTLARLPEIDEILPLADLDLGYLFPSNFAPKSPAPFQSIGSSGIL